MQPRQQHKHYRQRDGKTVKLPMVTLQFAQHASHGKRKQT